jgi:putative N6-adenine-specific DNA methylase
VAAGGALVDCMCGSGTFLTEAALMAHRVAPGLLRSDWALTAWHDFEPQAWKDALESARAEVRPTWGGVIAGCDRHPVRSSSNVTEDS